MRDNRKTYLSSPYHREPLSPVSKDLSSSFSLYMSISLYKLSKFLFYGYGILLCIISLVSPMPSYPLKIDYGCISISLAVFYNIILTPDGISLCVYITVFVYITIFNQYVSGNK